ncbi:MAG: DmsC/YnfH family molybdoenzyme membrane anchor subunit [Pseudomonadota bacterium]
MAELWERRPAEPDYAKLSQNAGPAENRYGQLIDLIDLTEAQGQALPKNRPLGINDNPSVGCNPLRNKQHGFYFNADNCIGCHACEAACAEKNETPAHLAFRSVGYVEGGSYPDYQRLNISMACNHCDDPVCLKGCPTAAYTKHAEYGAVLQDPDTCFGCGYCTWVCPYNAPQLDPVEGQVSKCNMCVDRLEVGLKPACVSACVGNALDFGVIETVPEGRQDADATIPGFPDPRITQPNIRFQQRKRLPDVLTRPDSQPLEYRREEGGYRSGPVSAGDPRVSGSGTRGWGLGRLNSRENALVAFTLLAQAGVGLLALGLFVDGVPLGPLLFAVPALLGAGLLASTTHLGKPLRFYRGFNNLRHSPVAREGAGLAACLALAGSGWLATLADWSTLAAAASALAGAAGIVGLYYMVRCYLIPARPFWNHWQVVTAFAGAALVFGAAGVAGLQLAFAVDVALHPLAWCLLIGIGVDGIGLGFHRRAMWRIGGEGAAAQRELETAFGRSYWLRNALLLASANCALGVALGVVDSAWFWGGCAMAGVAAALSRAFFYVLVIPTTMPGAFFWRNSAFADQARQTGLANLPQVGVHPGGH